MHTQRRYATCFDMFENKRCIPKEGMPHAHKACQKKERKEKDSPYPKKKKQERDDFIQRSSSTTDQKYTSIHTLAHLDQGL